MLRPFSGLRRLVPPSQRRSSSSHAAVLPTIYRSLLRLGRQLDENPLSKALLIAQPAHLFDRKARELVKLPSLSGWSSALEEFNGGEFYAPNKSAHSAVRDAFAKPISGDPIDVGFSAMRSLGLAVSGGEQLEREHAFDYGRPSAVERLSAVRAASEVRPGCLLLTHPVSCLKQPSLHHAVILLIGVDADGVTGLVINKGLETTLGAAVTDDARDAIGERLSDRRLYKGGDVSERHLLLLHDMEGLESSTTVVPGLYATSHFAEVRSALEEHETRAAVAEAMGDAVAGDAAGASAAATRSAHRPRLKCVAGLAGWAREQLTAELERNVWFLCEAEDVAALAFMEPPSEEAPAGAAAPAHDLRWLRDAMWSGSLAQLGAEHAKLARFPGDHEVVWRHMEALWKRQSEELHRRIDLLQPKGVGGDGQGDDGAASAA